MIDRTELVLMLLEELFEKSDDDLIEMAEKDLGLCLIERNIEDEGEILQLFEGADEDLQYEPQGGEYLQRLLRHYCECIETRREVKSQAIK